MKEKIEQIIDRNTEGNYLLSSTDKAQMVSEILDLVGVTDSLRFSENKFNPDDYECLAGVCPDLSDEEHCETCTLKRLKM